MEDDTLAQSHEGDMIDDTLIEAQTEPFCAAPVLAQLPIDLCLFILSSRPSSNYEHLKHILEFESNQLSTPSSLHMEENLAFQPPCYQSPFLPFSLPDLVISQIVRFLDPHDVLALSSSSLSWKHHLKNDFLALLELQWPVPTRSRRILSELASAFGGAVISPVYQWKQVYRYLEGIKEEVDLPIAYHEQVLAITALAHFSLISEGVGGNFDSHHVETMSWLDVASNSIVKSLLSLEQGRLRETLVTKLLKAHSELLNDFLEAFVRDVTRTHVVPVLDDYLEGKSEENALEVLLLLNEAWLKTKNFVRVLLASASPLSPLLSLHPSLCGHNLFNLKETLNSALKRHLWEPLKSDAFDLVLKCESSLSTHSQSLHALHSLFATLKEPALAQFMPTSTERSVKQPKHAILKTVDGFRYTVPIKRIRRLEACALDLERAENIGTVLDVDDVLDEELELCDLLLGADWLPLHEYLEFLDEIEVLDAQEQEDAKMAFTNKMFSRKDRREIAAVMLGARELKLHSFMEAILKTLERARNEAQEPASEDVE